ncbi:SH3 domain-containing protein [Thiomicrorhabdus sp.]|uniref:SH3 domain-containing protein n=1 Tax=Thiomicrorhabdus sp. TaxID=2039724 RepID=UPI0029C87692|nr:SH3 domain-containing protein [Thiomicrorhabdus sp.]
MLHRIQIIALLLAWPLAVPALAYERISVPPVDQSFRYADLQDFRNHLLNSVTARDTESVISMTTRDIYLSHGGHSGHDDLRQMLKAETYWADLERAIRLGGVFGEKEELRNKAPFYAPYITAVENDSPLNPFEVYVVTGQHVRVRSGPGTNHAIIGRLSYEVVRSRQFDKTSMQNLSEEGDHAWLPVEMPQNGQDGWISNRYLYPLVGTRMRFIFDGQKWLIDMIVSGD